jgi:hypothetical protein
LNASSAIDVTPSPQQLPPLDQQQQSFSNRRNCNREKGAEPIKKAQHLYKLYWLFINNYSHKIKTKIKQTSVTNSTL